MTRLVSEGDTRLHAREHSTAEAGRGVRSRENMAVGQVCQVWRTGARCLGGTWTRSKLDGMDGNNPGNGLILILQSCLLFFRPPPV